jgi:hypothetical protein
MMARWNARGAIVTGAVMALALTVPGIILAGGNAESTDPAANGERAAGQPVEELDREDVPQGALPQGALLREYRDQPPPGRAASEFDTDFSRATISFSEILSGGPPKDGIPSIDAPRFVSVDDARGWVAGREPVLVVEERVAAGGGRSLTRLGAGNAESAAAAAGGDTAGRGNTARGDATAVHIYPLQILTWHEIVNDVVGEIPVAVTYCPLCNTGIAFDRRHGGEVLDFGTTGRLRFSNLLMYDRQTESWWQQASGAGVIGHFAGTRLRMVPVMMLSFAEAGGIWPDARVLSRETGFSRAYGANPYVGYDSSERPFLFRGPTINGAFNPLDRVVSISIDGESAAVAFRELRETPLGNPRGSGRVVLRDLGGRYRERPRRRFHRRVGRRRECKTPSIRSCATVPPSRWPFVAAKYGTERRTVPGTRRAAPSQDLSGGHSSGRHPGSSTSGSPTRRSPANRRPATPGGWAVPRVVSPACAARHG